MKNSIGQVLGEKLAKDDDLKSDFDEHMKTRLSENQP